MAKEGSRYAPDFGLAAFYVEELSGDADLIYRFAYAMTLHRQEAFQWVKKVYQQAAQELSALAAVNTVKRRIRLFSMLRQIAAKKSPSPQVEKSPFAKLLQSLPVEERLALVAVDGGSLMIAEFAEVMEISVDDARAHLASARKALLKFTKM